MVVILKLMYNGQAINGQECRRIWSRFKGFMFKKNIHTFLYFNHCNSIHTFFMKECIDVILCDKNNVILYYYPNLKPNKVILPKRGVSKVFELPVHYFQFSIHERVEIQE